MRASVSGGGSDAPADGTEGTIRIGLRTSPEAHPFPEPIEWRQAGGGGSLDTPRQAPVSGQEPMDREPGEQGAEGKAERPVSEVDAAGVRDARTIAERVANDEAAADVERHRLLLEPLPVLSPDERVASLLESAELLHAVRTLALLEREGSTNPNGGTLYLTSRRLIHAVAAGSTSVELRDIDEAVVSLERLLLVRLHGGTHLAVEVDRPRLLRVQLAAARAAARGQEDSRSPSR